MRERSTDRAQSTATSTKDLDDPPAIVCVATRSSPLAAMLAGAGRNMAGDASMRNTMDSRSDCGGWGAARGSFGQPAVVGRRREEGWHPSSGARVVRVEIRRFSEPPRGFEVSVEGARTSGRNSSSSSSSSSWMLRHELAIASWPGAERG